MAEFRRASNEFRMQMEDELRIAEQQEQQKKIAAMQAAAPVTPALPETPAVETPAITDGSENTIAAPASTEATSETAEVNHDVWPPINASFSDSFSEPAIESDYEPKRHPSAEPLPIATSGDLKLMPPSTGLPVSNSAPTPALDSIAHTPDPTPTEAETNTNEVSHHG